MFPIPLSRLLAALLPDPLETLLADSLDHFSKQVKPALYAYLCETDKRAAVRKALNEGIDAAVAYLKPKLMKQFRLPAAAASAAATFIVKTLAVRGRSRLCAELERQLGPLPRQTPKRKSKRQTARRPTQRVSSARARSASAKRKPRAAAQRR